MIHKLKDRIKRIFQYASSGSSMISVIQLGYLGLCSSASFKSRPSALLRKLTPNLSVKPRLLRGFSLTLSPTDWSETLIYEEIYLNGAYNLNEVPFSPGHILDCGAHIGMFSLLASARWPDASLELFEPNPRNLQKIAVQKNRNKLSWIIHEGAVSETDGELWMEFPPRISHSSHVVSNTSEAGSRALRVRAYDLPAHLQNLNASQLLLKLDVEGAELDLWQPLVHSLPPNCALFFETHHDQHGWNVAREALEQCGFIVTLKSDRGTCRDGFALRTKAESL